MSHDKAPNNEGDKDPFKMYLKVEDNKRREFVDSKDFENASKGCLENANLFHMMVCVAKDTGNRYIFVNKAVFVNEALAIELYIKAILLARGYTPKEFMNLKHRIADLFNLFPEEERREIYYRIPPDLGVNSYEEFCSRLVEINEAFIVLRYSYERERLAFDAWFLFLFMATMHDYANGLLRQSE